MRKPVRSDEGAVELPEPTWHGTSPPDIARRRRQRGLPVTPEEQVAYARGEMRAPPVTVTQMATTLRAVLPQCSPVFAQALRDVAARCAQCTWDRGRDPGGDEDTEV